MGERHNSQFFPRQFSISMQFSQYLNLVSILLILLLTESHTTDGRKTKLDDARSIYDGIDFESTVTMNSNTTSE